MDPLYIIYTLFDIQVIFGLFNNSTIQHVLRNPKERERKNNVANIIFLKRRYVVRYSLSFLNWDRVESWWLAKSRFCGHKILHALWWGMDRLRLSLVYSILVLMSLSHPWPRAKEEISCPSSSGKMLPPKMWVLKIILEMHYRPLWPLDTLFGHNSGLVLDWYKKRQKIVGQWPFYYVPTSPYYMW